MAQEFINTRVPAKYQAKVGELLDKCSANNREGFAIFLQYLINDVGDRFEKIIESTEFKDFIEHFGRVDQTDLSSNEGQMLHDFIDLIRGEKKNNILLRDVDNLKKLFSLYNSASQAEVDFRLCSGTDERFKKNKNLWEWRDTDLLTQAEIDATFENSERLIQAKLKDAIELPDAAATLPDAIPPAQPPAPPPVNQDIEDLLADLSPPPAPVPPPPASAKISGVPNAPKETNEEVQRISHNAIANVSELKIAAKNFKKLVDQPAKIEEIKAAAIKVNKIQKAAQEDIKALKELNKDNAEGLEKVKELENSAEQVYDEANQNYKKYRSVVNAGHDDARKAAKEFLLATRARIESSHRNKPHSSEYLKAEENFAKASVAVMAAQKKAQTYGDVQSLNELDAAMKKSESMIDSDQKQKKAAAIQPLKSPPSAKAGGAKIEEGRPVFYETAIKKALGEEGVKIYTIRDDPDNALVSKEGKPQFSANREEVKAEIKLTDNPKATQDFLKISKELCTPPLYVYSADPKEREYIKKVAGEMIPPVIINVIDNEAAYKKATSKAPEPKVEEKKAAPGAPKPGVASPPPPSDLPPPPPKHRPPAPPSREGRPPLSGGPGRSS